MFWMAVSAASSRLCCFCLQTWWYLDHILLWREGNHSLKRCKLWLTTSLLLLSSWCWTRI